MNDSNFKKDRAFLTSIICEICDYAAENEMSPNETLKTIANNILSILKISNFDGWRKKEMTKMED